MVAGSARRLPPLFAAPMKAHFPGSWSEKLFCSQPTSALKDAATAYKVDIPPVCIPGELRSFRLACREDGLTRRIMPGRGTVSQLLDPLCRRFLRFAHGRIRHFLPRFPFG